LTFTAYRRIARRSRSSSASSSRSAACDGGGGQEPRQRRLLRLGVDAPVVDLLDPGGEQAVELGQAPDAAANAGPSLAQITCCLAYLDQELVADGFEEPLDLASTGWSSRLTVGEPDPEHGAGPAQPAVDKHGSVVDVMPTSA